MPFVVVLKCKIKNLVKARGYGVGGKRDKPDDYCQPEALSLAMDYAKNVQAWELSPSIFEYRNGCAVVWAGPNPPPGWTNEESALDKPLHRRDPEAFRRASAALYEYLNESKE